MKIPRLVWFPNSRNARAALSIPFFLVFDQSRHLFLFRLFVPHRVYLVAQDMLAVNLGCTRIAPI